MEKAYGRSRRTIFGHVIFLGVACTVAIVLRRSFKLTPILLATVLIVALLVFAGDIMKFLYHRNELRRLRAAKKLN
jgi:hypothetical protein